jgi:pimeloyl-ACP methyl ester carboxylesterase
MPVQLNVREAGEGVPLVLLHAFPLSSAMWLHQRETLSSVCRVVTPDLRGFGGSVLPEDGEAPSMDVMADDVATTIKALGLDDVVLVGLSLGGYIAMAFWRRHPDLLRGLVLADTKASADPEPARANRLRIAETVLDEQSPRVLIEDVLPNLVGPTTKEHRPMVYGRVRALVETAPPAAVAWAQRAMAARPDSTGTLREVSVPTLVLVGEEDQLTPLSAAEAMVAAVPDARLITVPEAGHLTPLEQPEVVDEALLEFLHGLS